MRTLDKVAAAFWSEYDTRIDQLNRTVRVYGPVYELYVVAQRLRDIGVFKGIVVRDDDHITIRVVEGHEPPRP